MKIVAGIDGGGTKTTLIIKVLETGESYVKKYGPFNINSIGRDAFILLVDNIFDTIRKFGECLSLCIGAAGISNKDMEQILVERAGKHELADRLIIKGDQDIALYGAMEGAPGAILIAGTGSIGIGINADRDYVRVGGRGHLIDDPGSGYALGRDALSAYVKAEDGRGPATQLTEMINERWCVTNAEDVIRIVYPLRDKGLVASLAPLVLEAAQNNDKVAIEILDKGAEDLLSIVRAMSERYNNGKMKLSLMGGLMSDDSYMRQKLVELIEVQLPEVLLVAPAMSAAEGALLTAEQTVIWNSEKSF